MIRHWSRFLFLSIFLLAAGLRLTGVNWDDGHHLHPDERFLTLLQLDLKMPEHFFDYLDPQKSTLNPFNQGIDFMVYGAMPVVMNKTIGLWLGTDTYELGNLQGRVLSAIADLLTLVFLYRLVKLFEPKILPKTTALWASLLYALAVLPIQLSHYYATDSFLVLGMTACLFFALKWFFKPSFKTLFQMAFWFAFALACKITAVFLVPILGVIFAATFVQERSVKQHSWKFMTQIITWVIVVYGCLRILNPSYFESANWFDPTINAAFLRSLVSLKAMSDPGAWYPPSVQWLHKPPVWFTLKNFALYSVGLPWFTLLLVGSWQYAKKLFQELRRHQFILANLVLAALLSWAGCYFLYQSVQFAKNMRYLAPLIPVFAIFASYGAVSLITAWQKIKYTRSLIFAACLIWPLAFLSIYLQPHTRVAASHWIYDNLPNKSVIASEYWDDGLPLPQPSEKHFSGKEVVVFDFDTPEKWEKVNQAFSQSDYYVLSSNRGWGSIPTAPERYPLMTEYYQKLFAGETEWKLIKTFTSYPSLRYLGIPIDFVTDTADESFTVYDHPKVMIFASQTKLKTLNYLP